MASSFSYMMEGVLHCLCFHFYIFFSRAAQQEAESAAAHAHDLQRSLDTRVAELKRVTEAKVSPRLHVLAFAVSDVPSVPEVPGFSK